MNTNTKKLKSEKNLFFFDSEAELKIISHLNDIINTAHYVVFPHLTIAEAFRKFIDFDEISEIYASFCEHKRKLLPADKISILKERQIALSHFDFVIFDKENYVPVLIIEINGRSHATDEITKASDAFKEYICKQVLGRPFLTLELFESQEDLKEALISAIKESKFDNKYDYPVYCKHCGRKMTYKDKNDGGYFYFCQFCQDEGKYKGKDKVKVTQGPENITPIFINM